MDFAFSQAPTPFSDDTAASTSPITLGSAVAVGDLVVGFNTWDDTGLTETVTVADNLTGNTYTVESLTKNRDSTNTQSIVMWWSLILGTGTPTITATHPGNRGFRRMAVAVYTGARRTSPRDQTGTNFQTGVGTGTNAITCAAAGKTRFAGELVVVGVEDTGGSVTYTAGTSPVQHTIRASATTVCIEDAIFAGSGSFTGTCTQSGANQRILTTLLTFIADGTPPDRPESLPVVYLRKNR